jgi:flagellar basal body-associated protein FliL
LLPLRGENGAGRKPHPKGGSNRMSILWIILIVILVLALLGFFSRGRW